MSNPKPPPSDKTVFDPLDEEELRALREARNRARQKKAESRKPSAAATAATVPQGNAPGPHGGEEDLGDAPTQAMKAIPRLDSGGVSLENLGSTDLKPVRLMPDPQPLPPQSSVRQPAAQPPADEFEDTLDPSQPDPDATLAPGGISLGAAPDDDFGDDPTEIPQLKRNEPAPKAGPPPTTVKVDESRPVLDKTKPLQAIRMEEIASATPPPERVEEEPAPPLEKTRPLAAVQVPKKEPTKPLAQAQAPLESEPEPELTVSSTQPTPLDSPAVQVPTPSEPAPAQAPAPAPTPQQGEPGFGDSTQLWMNAIKAPTAPKANPAVGLTPAPVEPIPKSRKAAVGAILVLAAFCLVAVVSLLFGGGGEPSDVELVTIPQKATVKINGKATSVKTPMKAKLHPGTHTVEVSLPGYRTETFTLEITEGAAPTRKEISLFPVSKPGLMTVSIQVAPVSGNITLDGKTHSSTDLVRLPNIDPKKDHKIVVEAGGYQKIEQDVKAGELKEEYNFVLQSAPEE